MNHHKYNDRNCVTITNDLGEEEKEAIMAPGLTKSASIAAGGGFLRK